MHDWRLAVSTAQRLEVAGYDGIMSQDGAHEPFGPLIAAALVTERVALQTGIVVAFPRSPMVTAMHAWDLHSNSGGRFQLGLGSQVRGHNERRFSVSWSAPAPRMREYIEALRAIWRSWEQREKLRFEDKHYHFDLLSPNFAPRPTGLPPVPITLAAVGPGMLRLAGRVADGVRLHGFGTRCCSLLQGSTVLDEAGPVSWSAVEESS